MSGLRCACCVSLAGVAIITYIAYSIIPHNLTTVGFAYLSSGVGDREHLGPGRSNAGFHCRHARLQPLLLYRRLESSPFPIRRTGSRFSAFSPPRSSPAGSRRASRSRLWTLSFASVTSSGSTPSAAPSCSSIPWSPSPNSWRASWRKFSDLERCGALRPA